MTQPSQPSQTTPPAGGRESVSPGRVGLVDLQTAVELWGLPSSAVLAMVECGQVKWAWDVSVSLGPVRAIRLWQCELFTAEMVRALDLSNVIEAVIGHPTELRLQAQTVASVLMLSDKTVQDLVAAGELSGAAEDSGLWITRASLAEFLARRLIV